MRIAFHADLTHNQAAVLWRCRDDLAGLGVDLFDALSSPDAPADAHVVHSAIVGFEPLMESLLAMDVPVAILERIDGAQLTGPVRRFLPHPNLVAVIKNTVYADWRKYNSACWRGHEWACRKAMGAADPEPLLPDRKWIDETDYAKLHVGFSFAAYDHMQPLFEAPAPTGDRPYLLNFAGTVDYGPDVPWLNWHRQRCVEAIQAIPGNHFCEVGRPLSREEYWDSLRKSVFCVSPWGLGEPCWRDFEGVMCGCVVIKPDTRHIRTQPEGFYAREILSCAADFSNMGFLLKMLIGTGTSLRVPAASNRVKESASTEATAARMAQIFVSCFAGQSCSSSV